MEGKEELEVLEEVEVVEEVKVVEEVEVVEVESVVGGLAVVVVVGSFLGIPVLYFVLVST